MTSISQMISQAGTTATTAMSGSGTTDTQRLNDGYESFGGSVLRNAAIGAATGAIIAMPTGIGLPIGAGVGAALGAGSALIRHPRVSAAVGDGMKGMMAGAAGGALVGTVTPFGPIGGAVAGGIGGFLTGTVSGMLKNVAGGRFSIEKETTVWGRVTKGFAPGAVSGAAVGAGAGLLFGGIGALPGALWGAAIGGIGGAIHGATTGVTDAATGAKGVSFLGGGQLPHLPNGPGGTDPGKDPGQGQIGQYPTQSVNQCPPTKVA